MLVFMQKKVRLRLIFFYMPMTLLVYKEACFNSNKLNSYIPSVYVSLQQDYIDIFPDEIPKQVELIKTLLYMIKYKQDKENILDDILS